MTEKARIIDALGEPSLLLPALLADALAANDRVKFYFSLLQAAQLHATHPGHVQPSLSTERGAAGIADDSLDALPGLSELIEDDLYRIPGAETLCAAIATELDTLLAPLRTSGDDAAASLAARLSALRGQAWCTRQDSLSREQITRLVSGDREAGDSAHLLVMDMHKALLRLQAQIASEDIDGAAAYEISSADRPLIAAFMRGVNETRPLKFDHPGLGTTATRSGERLILQNDIGTTDAHVLVVHVEKGCVRVTYTDVHIQRLLFFQSLFAHWAVSWDDTRSRTDRDMDDGVYHISTGTFTANNEAGLSDYLCFLGSRLVFLIDWNRARKRLRLLLPKKESLAVLKWAADEGIGHMGWLRAGGEQLVFDALAFAARTPPTFGARLDDTLDRSRAIAFMQFVFRTCTRAQLENHPDEEIRDALRIELVTCFRSTRQQLIDIAAEHAALGIEIAAGLRDCLLDLAGPEAREHITRNAGRARRWEHQADELVNLARELQRQNTGHGDFYCALIEGADDIVDELEEAAFHLGLFPPTPPGLPLLEALGTLASLSVSSAQELLKALESARGVRQGGPREDLQDFLESIHHIMAAERQSDEAHRSFKRALIADSSDFRDLYACAECARNLENAADLLLHTAMQLRDHVLGAVTGD